MEFVYVLQLTTLDLLLKCHPIQYVGASIMKYDVSQYSTFLDDPSNISE
jgi:hypothetical protein